MKGTAILFQVNQNFTILENVEHSVFKEIKSQCGCTHCNCKLDNHFIDFGTVSPVFWHEEDVDWDYGY